MIRSPLMLCATSALALALALPASASKPYPTKDTPAALDRGALTTHGEAPFSVTVALKLHDLAGAEALLQHVSTEGDPAYHKFLTPEAFRAKFGPTEADIRKVTDSLAGHGLTVERIGSTALRATGTPSAMERAFGVQLHQFEVPASKSAPGYTYRAPLAAPALPGDIADQVHGVFGLSDRPNFRPHSRHVASRLRNAHVSAPHTGGTLDPLGEWTVLDFASYYDVTPLYNAKITGAGRTVAIVTLASFTPSDAFGYWSSLALTVDPTRLTEIPIDGGAGAPSDAAGSDETTLDVEQSGGIAPGANILVYEAPNTSQAFYDAFAQAIDDNKADSISTSWGEWEWFDNADNSPVAPYPKFPNWTVGFFQATHQLFVQAGLQGQSVFAAAGDEGAYDVNDGTDGDGYPILPPYYSLTLSVDYPASDPAITAAGGTTLPFTGTFFADAIPVTVTVPRERVWGWDYLANACAINGYDPIDCGILPAGSGGGVSIEFLKPFYQYGLSSVVRSEPGQSLVEYLTVPPQTIYDLPAYFPGRNVPDVSFNADPETGYAVAYTSSQDGFGVDDFWGGTSFVAPQLNAVAALIGEAANSRIGLVNYQLYGLARYSWYPRGWTRPVREITSGTNEFYGPSPNPAKDNYSPAAGVGTLDVAAFAQTFRKRW